MSDPLAYLITWTCYGNWMHGDDRGAVDRQHNVPGTPLLPPDRERAAKETARQRNAPVHLGQAAQRVVTGAITDHCRQRGWTLLAVNVRSNHVHVVVGFCAAAPEDIMGQFKAWSTRRLRQAGLVHADDRVWTRGGSTRYIWEPRSVDAAVAYVLEGQDARR